MINYDALCFGFVFIIGALFLMAWLGMSGSPHHVAGKPPEKPPGKKR